MAFKKGYFWQVVKGDDKKPCAELVQGQVDYSNAIGIRRERGGWQITDLATGLACQWHQTLKELNERLADDMEVINRRRDELSVQKLIGVYVDPRLDVLTEDMHKEARAKTLELQNGKS